MRDSKKERDLKLSLISKQMVRYIKVWVDGSPEDDREEEVDFQQMLDGPAQVKFQAIPLM